MEISSRLSSRDHLLMKLDIPIVNDPRTMILDSLIATIHFGAVKGMAVASQLFRPGRSTLDNRLAAIGAFAELPALGLPPLADRVLIDGMFDNPNYWARLGLARRALGFQSAHQVGLTSVFTQQEVCRTFREMGVSETISWENKVLSSIEGDREALAALKCIACPEDILDMELPFGFPAALVYDGLLKRQRRAVVDIHHRNFRFHLIEAFRSIYAAGRLIDRVQPDLLVMSHHINFSCGSLVWQALRRNIPVIVLYGFYGSLRFFRPRTSDDLWNFMDRPMAADMDAIDPEIAKSLRVLGEAYMESRLGGRVQDIGAVYAFGRQPITGLTRIDICARFGWDPGTPIVAIYTGNWFDNIHGCGMSHFRDLLDWLEATLRVAEKNRECNWLLRGHPCDEWFKSVRLDELVPQISGAHIGLAPDTWNGAEVLNASDAVVSYHSTASIEYACKGKPALLADRGWYHDCGFTVWPNSREEYLDLLASRWWESVNCEDIRSRALLFAGWFFGRLESVRLWRDDSLRNDLYPYLAKLPKDHREELDRETIRIREWFESGSRSLHTFTIARGGIASL